MTPGAVPAGACVIPCVTCGGPRRGDDGKECGPCRVFRWRNGYPRPDRLIVAASRRRELARNRQDVELLEYPLDRRDFAPPARAECSEEMCWQPVYRKGRCKRHADEFDYRRTNAAAT